MKVVSAAQMRAMDRRTIEEFHVPGLVLMENAALRVVEILEQRYAPLKNKQIAVICGKGNNGGDGLAIARHLATRYGAEVTIRLVADPERLTGDALANFQMAQAFGLGIRQWGESGSPSIGGEGGLIVDALLGTGFTGAVEGEFAQTIDAINSAGCPVVSVDIPSGLNADTGEIGGPCVRATLTVTFALPKFGLLASPGMEYVGELVVADIGMPHQVMQADDAKVSATDAAAVARWLPARTNGRDINKGTFGHVLVFAGSGGFVGAPTLAAEAAARTGAGLVTLAVPESIHAPVMSRVSPVVMTRGLPETPQGTFSAAALDAALSLADKGTAVALGPGMGGGGNDDTRRFLREFVARCPKPLVLDADALNILSDELDHGAFLVKSRMAATVLTPHPGEMGRLLGKKTAEIQANRRAAVEQAAQEFGCVVLLKGDRTLIAVPDGALWINKNGNPGMATGGAGDVLTGIIAALLVCGLGATEAAAAGAYLHGLAGDLAAARLGGLAGLIATDIIETLPRAIGHCQGETR